MNNPSLTSLLNRLWQCIAPRRQRQLCILMVLMLFAAIAEIFSIGAVLPFLGALTSPENAFEHPALQSSILFLGVTKPSQLLLPLTIGFGIVALTAGAIRMLLLWASIRISFAIGADISISMYRRTLYQPYSLHIARNSSEVISGITNKAHAVTFNIVLPALTLISNSLIMIAILAALVVIEPIIALATFGGFSLIYLMIIRLTRNKLLANSQVIASESVEVIKALQEGLGGIRDVLIDGSQSTYCQIYSKADASLRKAQASSAFIGVSPRYAVEVLGIILIITLAYSLSGRPDGISGAIPILGALALAALRLLPVIQQAYGAWTSIRSTQVTLRDVVYLLNQPVSESIERQPVKALAFQQSISVSQLGFRYSSQLPFIFKNINFTILKGSRVGFIGATGCGKSTLLDIIMGLLQPTEGRILIDNHPLISINLSSWQANIAHVPQTIFLADSTIEENIAFGVPKGQINSKRVYQAAKKAKIAELIETWPDQYKTQVGERGIRLSGGQRQRIGIARALYKNATVIVFDEATSALDGEIEQDVMEAIYGIDPEITILIVAHRLTTLKKCDVIFKIESSDIVRATTYREVAFQDA